MIREQRIYKYYPQTERNRINRILAVAFGATDISWSTAKAERVARRAALAAYAAMMREIDTGYKKRIKT